jgi:methionyl-tRNA formyltransferase
MDLIFMGTPDFALPSLEAILASRHRVLAVVSGPDVSRGRGLHQLEPPVKRVAQKAGLPVLQPESLNTPDFIEALQAFKPDLFIVVAFRILPNTILEIPQFGAINLHASLLPKYRGAAPINWALINGDKITGITIFQIRPTVDTGDILIQQQIPIMENETYGELYQRLAQLGAGAVVAALDGIEKDSLEAYPQDNLQVSKAPKIYPELGLIDWNQSAPRIRNLIHGLSPSPGAYSFFKGKRIKFLRAQVSEDNSSVKPGQIAIRDKSGYGIQTGAGILLPLELQMEGKKALSIEQFVAGFYGQVGEWFGT